MCYVVFDFEGPPHFAEKKAMTSLPLTLDNIQKNTKTWTQSPVVRTTYTYGTNAET